ncbi:MAG: RecBCD enzyme subunit RecD [Synechococcus sp. MIT S9220]|nr:MAG: RecBCD enzyme subunit RecD [Synechococcus sp. MIT S9220]
MVDSSLLSIALQCAHPFKTRLVFVGDPAQLPPVGESESPVFGMNRAVSACLREVVRHQGPVLQLASCLRDGRLPCEVPPLLPPVRSDLGQVGVLSRGDWLSRAQEGLRRAAACDNPDAARILCYTNRRLEALVPHARRAIHGEMADQMAVLPGEVLITRTAVMAPASSDGGETGEEPDLVLGSNRELVVEDVSPERCDLAEFGVAGEAQLSLAGLGVPVIETLNAKVRSGELELKLRLQPPSGSQAREQLDALLKRLAQEARNAGKRGGRSLWRQYFLVRDAFASLGPAAVLTVHRSQGSSFGEVFVADDVFPRSLERLAPERQVFHQQLAYVAVSRARHGVYLVGDSQRNAATWSKALRGIG